MNDDSNSNARQAKRARKHYEPAHLGKRSRGPIRQVDRIPWQGGALTVALVCDEFTSLCPVTDQPDFGTLTVRYEPTCWLIESKSLKLYYWQFRERGFFNETLVAAIADELFERVRPEWIEVAGDFHSRGGIAIHATARRENLPVPF
jgi:7-cyano-7-deazaguanine reductase